MTLFCLFKVKTVDSFELGWGLLISLWQCPLDPPMLLGPANFVVTGRLEPLLKGISWNTDMFL